MGNMRCKIPEELEELALQELTGDWLTQEEEQRIRDTLPHYLGFETYGRRNFRECICTHEECGISEYERVGRVDIYQEDFFRKHHGDEIDCPACGNPVKLIAFGRIRSGRTLRATSRVTICRNGKDGALLLISGYATIEPTWNDFRPSVDFSICALTYLKPGIRMQWRAESIWEWGVRYTTGWVPQKTVQEPFRPAMLQHDGSGYFLFTDRILDSALKYSQVAEWYDKSFGVDIYDERHEVRNVVKYLSAYTEYPQIEYAVKAGLISAVDDLVIGGIKHNADLNWRAKTVPAFLRLSKRDAKMFLEAHGNLDILMICHQEQKEGRADSVAEITEVMRDIPVNMFHHLRRCATVAGINIRQAARYVNKHTTGRETQRDTLQIWADYLNMAEKLGYNLAEETVVMPKNLRERHNSAAEMIAAAKNKKTNENYKKSGRYRKLCSLYEFSMCGYSIIVPKALEEITREGQTLRHCVAGYGPRHMDGKTDILFLRKSRKPGTPYITIEMEPRKAKTDKVRIRQIHGYRNEMCGKIVKPEIRYGWLLDAWRTWMQQGSRRDSKGNPIIDKKEQTA